MYKTILVTLDGTRSDQAIIEHVKHLAKLAQSRVVLLHVADGWAARTYGRDAVSPEIWSPPQHDYCNDGKGFDKPTNVKGYPQRGFVHFRHSEGFNAVFVDGHAKWLRRTTYDMWARDPSSANRDQRGKPCWKFW